MWSAASHDRSSGGNKGATLIRHASSNRVFRRKYGTIKRGKSMMALACDDDGGTGLRYFHYVEINEKDGSRLGAVLFTVHSARPSKSSRSNSTAAVQRERSANVALSPAMKDAVRVRPLGPAHIRCGMQVLYHTNSHNAFVRCV